MTNLKRQIVAAIAAGSLMLTPTASVFASTTLEISGNGSSSDNNVEVERSNSTTVVQSNSAVVTNNVSSKSSTGGNEANDNTGGDVMIRTGDASSNVTVSNLLNSNTAEVDCCDQGDVDAKISGNGSYSDNEIEIESEHRRDSSETQVFQDNTAVVSNFVDGSAKTGYNDANRNTGGDVMVRTGDAMANVDVSTTANANVAVVGGQGDNDSKLSAVIAGNGSYSDNDVKLELENRASIVQDNFALVTNFVDAYAKTGSNDANDNTGGEVGILTGNAKAKVEVDNMVNFNAADIDCGCVLDAEAKISGNGYDSDNFIKAELEEDLSVFQGGEKGDGNNAILANFADAYAKTGKNDVEYNTGEATDPFVWTGNAYSETVVSNAGNANIYGDALHWDLPEFHWDFNLSHMFWN